jgi:Pectate lyase superfamily protein
MYFSKLRILVVVATSTLAGLSNTDVAAQQTFNGTTTFNGNVFMKGPGPWYDVKAFGAKGDATIDDTANIQLAIDAAGAAGGGTVFFPPGRYLVSASLKDRIGTTRYRHLELRGAGNAGWGGTSAVGISSIVAKTSIGNILDFGVAGGFGNPFGPQIKDLGFEDLRSPQSGTLNAIKITNTYHIQIQDVTCENFKTGACISLNAVTQGDVVQYGSFIDVKSRKTKFGFELLGFGSQFILLGGHFTAPDDPAGSIGIHIEQPGTCPVPTNSATCFGHTDTIQIINPSLESFETGIKLWNADAIRVGARIENFPSTPCMSNATTCVAIAIDGSDANHKSDGNIIMGSTIGTFEVGIQLGQNAKRTQIIGNSLVNTGQQINVNANARDGTIIIGPTLVGNGSGTGGARWTSGDGFPLTNNNPVCEYGSLYTRTDIGKLYVCETVNNLPQWVPK